MSVMDTRHVAQLSEQNIYKIHASLNIMDISMFWK